MEEEKQLPSKLDEFKSSYFKGMEEADKYLEQSLEAFKQNLEEIKKFPINCKPIFTTEIYKTHKPVFIEIINNVPFVNALVRLYTGVSFKEVTEKKISPKILLEKLGLKLEEDNFEDKMWNTLFEKMDKSMERKVTDMFLMEEKPMSNLLRCLKEYQEIDERIKKVPDEKIKEIVSLSLFKDMYEQYLGFLKLLYCKYREIPQIKNTKAFWKWLNQYPLLWSGFNPELRHDFSHYLCSVRDNYTINKIDEERTVILSKLITGIVCMNEAIFEFFEKSVKGLHLGD